MIASLRGTVIDKGLDFAVIECHGVGYLCSATPETLAHLSRGEEAFVYTTMVVREDAQLLFAFSTTDQRTIFTLLQTVSGVAAKTALGIMAVVTPDELVRAIRESDLKTLQRASGVGKKLAERMVLELRDKVGAIAPEAAPQSAAGDPQLPVDVHESVQAQVTEALVGLGFPESKASAQAQASIQALVEAGADQVDASTVLRQALATMGTK
ncbi:Holliday junction branch migration protein RuvA [Corynebacterium sp. 320]|uniref:Holliday junction branch migration complex subunit RuvA n=1 Tax=Corynebacterium zhongnanshanii TaxID=2768834 RepID=A0ABQ6VG83_9CORY|nr:MULTISPECIES: Holliday junction branch migration protein RuvA [Corynebacterium]KAB1503726.1 Holliday junction branch migration protein RuvA [Corynebacterium sp. 320]KAB1553174.1 Holliday junction branch migration protein RuvA [Corynebacterium sp. 321]KAB1553608.1 Holliday junction branch migration protein RuvA [Corynebacterium sp. 319]KAB3523424.1 Holliday junction branch migration protein RuvA [Corynebacterium zhongnanshanii]KAB3527862.1 Holliday junction branch migration protein RuvA [Cor